MTSIQKVKEVVHKNIAVTGVPVPILEKFIEVLNALLNDNRPSAFEFEIVVSKVLCLLCNTSWNVCSISTNFNSLLIWLQSF